MTKTQIIYDNYLLEPKCLDQNPECSILLSKHAEMKILAKTAEYFPSSDYSLHIAMDCIVMSFGVSVQVQLGVYQSDWPGPRLPSINKNHPSLGVQSI